MEVKKGLYSGLRLLSNAKMRSSSLIGYLMKENSSIRARIRLR
jgi:hypothetical protein